MPEKRTTIFLPPTDTVKVWQERGELKPTVRWSEMMHQEHASAFTVAKIAKLDLLRNIRASLDNVIVNGGTFEQWKADILPELKKQGWWGVVQDGELTGTDEKIIVNDRRLRTIYRTNTRMSIAAGRWRRYQAEKKSFPYLRYRSDHPRKHPRQQHLGWHGLILPIDDPWWQTHFPPNGWGCNCIVEQVSEAMMKRSGWHVSQPPAEGPRIPFYPAGKSQPIMVPPEIDPGFSYNPGIAHLQAVAAKAMRSVVQAEQAGLRGAAKMTVRELVADPAFEQFVALPDIEFPFAWLDDAGRSALSAEGSLVRFSSATLIKQSAPARRRSDIGMDEYRAAADIIADAVIALRQPNSRLVLIGQYDGAWMRAVVKTTADGRENYLLSLHRLRARSLAAEIRRSELLWDRR